MYEAWNCAYILVSGCVHYQLTIPTAPRFCYIEPHYHSSLLLHARSRITWKMSSSNKRWNHRNAHQQCLRCGIHALAQHHIRTAMCHPSIRYSNINAASRTHRFSDAPRLHARYSFLHTTVTHEYDKTILSTPFLKRTAFSRSLYIPLCATHEYYTTIIALPLLETAISATPIPALWRFLGRTASWC
jgi:hypothetical protein